MRSKYIGILLAISVISLLLGKPVQTFASCAGPDQSPYQSISRIDFFGWGAAPEGVDANGKLIPGKIGNVSVQSTPKRTQVNAPIFGAGMALYVTEDPSQAVFDRLIAVMKADDFFSITGAQQQQPPLVSERNVVPVEYGITVVECGTSKTLRESLLLDESRHVKGSSKLRRLFDDLIAATYQSRWHPIVIAVRGLPRASNNFLTE